MHGTDHPHAAVQTRDGPNRNYRRYRHLSRHSRSLCRYSRHAHLRVTTPRLHSTKFTFTPTPGDAAACSRMATDISRVYSDLTHAVFLPTHGRSLTRGASFTHTTPLTPAGALTHGVSSTQGLLLTPVVPLTYTGALTRGVCLTQGGSHTRAASHAHVVSSPCGAPFTHGVPGSTHSGTLANTPLTHGGSLALGVALGVAHGVSLTPFTTHTHRDTRTGDLIYTRGSIYTQGHTHTRSYTRAMRASQHAFPHTCVHTHRDIHSGDSRHHKSSRGLHTPQALRAPVRSTPPLDFTWP